MIKGYSCSRNKRLRLAVACKCKQVTHQYNVAEERKSELDYKGSQCQAEEHLIKDSNWGLQSKSGVSSNGAEVFSRLHVFCDVVLAVFFVQYS